MSGMAERLDAALRKCRVDDDAPIPLLNESDRYHVLQMLLPVVEREIAAARGEALREAADAIDAAWHAIDREHPAGRSEGYWEGRLDGMEQAETMLRAEVRKHNHPASKQCRNDCPSGHPSTWAVGDEHHFRAEDET